MNQVAFGRETLKAFYEDAAALLQDHNIEVCLHPQAKLAIDLPWYEGLEQLGQLRIFTIRELPNLGLAGYAVFVLAREPRHMSLWKAVGDAVYVLPAARKGWTASRLIGFSERELAGDGVDIVYHCVPDGSLALKQILRRRGYASGETLYSKRLH
jgi:GNAT superfamily N-acetyltransferase